MLSLCLALVIAQVDVQARTVAFGKVPAIAHTPVARQVNDAIHLLFASQADGTSDQDFAVQRNDSRLLVLKVTGEGCGAYCETWERVASFDMRSGRLLTIGDLVTAKGQKAMASMMLGERKRRYKAEAATNTAALKNTKDKDLVEDLEGRVALNEGCAQSAETYDVRYSVGQTSSIVMTSGRCSNHATRALDDVGEVTLEIPAAKLELTAYGKALLAQGPDAPPPATPFGHVLHGTVGKAAITALLEKPSTDGSLSGLYFYDKHRKAIALYGKAESTRLTLEEDGGTMTLEIRGAALTGAWTGNGKELPVALE